MPKKVIEKKVIFGGGRIANISPSPKENSPKIVNLTISFEEALKLHVAIEEGLMVLNRHNRAKREGKRTALNLAVHLDPKAMGIAVLETKLPLKKKA